MRPIVTVGIPTRDRPDLLHEAITSVLNQTRQDFEIFVSDNSRSTDTIEVLEAFKDRRIRYCRYGRPIPMAANWQQSFLAPRSKYVAMLQDDDYWGPNHLEYAIECLESEPLAASYSCAIQHIESGAILEIQRAPGYELLEQPRAFEPEETLRIAFRRHTMQLSSVVCRRDALEGLDWGPVNVFYPIDLQIIIMAALKGLWIYDPRPEAFLRHHARSLTNTAPRLYRKFYAQADHAFRILAIEAIRRGCFEEKSFLQEMSSWPRSQLGGIVVAFSAPYAPTALRQFARKMISRFPEIICSPDTSRHCRIAARIGRWYLPIADPLNRLRATWWPIGRLSDNCQSPPRGLRGGKFPTIPADPRTAHS